MKSLRNLIDGMPGQRAVLLGIINYCREPKSPEDVDAQTEKLQKANTSVYTPVLLRQHLEAAGALQYISNDDEQNIASAPGEPDGIGGLSINDSAISECDAACQEEIAPEPDLEQSFAPALAADEPYEPDGPDGPDGERNIALGPEYLTIVNKPKGYWLSSTEALAFLESMDFGRALEQMLAEEPQYREIYLRILSFCVKNARSKEQLNMLVDNDLLLQNPRRYSGYFIERLDECGALAWMPNWQTTDVGLALLEDFSGDLHERADGDLKNDAGRRAFLQAENGVTA
ncbi:MAG: hypothetical protein LBG97_03170 [Coriobacteriales bacterium]|jgi:hypothetical protein|nr:hypothetical protein [Coriobacteriales bacterium]